MKMTASEVARPTLPILFPILVLGAMVGLMIATGRLNPVFVFPLLWLLGDIRRIRRLTGVGQILTLLAMAYWLIDAILGLASIPAYAGAL